MRGVGGAAGVRISGAAATCARTGIELVAKIAAAQANKVVRLNSLMVAWIMALRTAPPLLDIRSSFPSKVQAGKNFSLSAFVGRMGRGPG